MSKISACETSCRREFDRVGRMMCVKSGRRLLERRDEASN